MSDTEGVHAALVAALGALPDITADSTADTGTFSYKYASLPAIMKLIRPVLTSNGLAVLQPVTGTSTEVGVETIILHRDGSMVSGGVVTREAKGTPQQMGSLITYLRRYALCSLLGIAIDDDDDAAQSSHRQRPTRTVQAPRRERPASGGSLTESQKRHIMALFGGLGISGPDHRPERLAVISAVIGREIDTTNDVTREEANMLIEHLKRQEVSS